MSKTSVLPSGMKLVGDVNGKEDLVVCGDVEGEVQIDGVLVVERTGSVRGNVQARTVAIRGVVVGDASATEAIRVDEGGRVVGDVRAPRVNIVKGARFRGHVHMTGREPARGPALTERDTNAIQATLGPSSPAAPVRAATPAAGSAPATASAAPVTASTPAEAVAPAATRAPVLEPAPAVTAPRAPERHERRLRRQREEGLVETPSSEQPTSAGTVRAVHQRRTVPGTEMAAQAPRPPAPRMPALRRQRVRRKDPHPR